MKAKFFLPVLASAVLAVANDVHAQSTVASNAATGTAPNAAQYLGFSNGYDLLFKTNSAEKMRIINSTGNINIGPIVNTSQSPTAKVTIQQASTINNTADNIPGLSVAKQITASYSRALMLVPHLSSGGYSLLSQNGDAGIIWTDGGNGAAGTGNKNYDGGFVITPHKDSYYGMRITNLGNVGIGTPLTSNPNNYKLAVNGTIGAKAVTIETTSTTWPDYVFESKYKLKTIEELETFVNTHKHLPNVPSACEVEEKGVNLGEMDAHLLEKIEELSLYIIQLKKENQKQESDLSEKLEELTSNLVQLKKENEELMKRMEEVEKQ